jgi:hypothetical protein
MKYKILNMRIRKIEVNIRMLHLKQLKWQQYFTMCQYFREIIFNFQRGYHCIKVLKNSKIVFHVKQMNGI